MTKANDSTQKHSLPASEPRREELPPLPPLTVDPQPSPLEINPTTKAADPLPPGPKIEVSQVSPPQAPMQQPIDKKLQLDAIAKAVCKNQGHRIVALPLRQVIPSELPNQPPKLIENTVVVCEKCGASLAQIRG